MKRDRFTGEQIIGIFEGASDRPAGLKAFAKSPPSDFH